MKEKIVVWLEKFWLKNKKTFIYIGVVVVLLLIFYMIGRWSTQEERRQSINNLIAARDSVHSSIMIINGLENIVYEQNAMILTEKTAKEVGILEIERLKKLHMKEVVTNAELKGVIKILRDSLIVSPDFVFITVKDTTGVIKDYARIPFTLFDIKEKYLILSAGMDKNKKAWFNLETPVEGIMTIGYKKSGFLKTTPVGVFTTENPYLIINQMDILIVQESKKWYNKWWVKPAAGILVWEGLRKAITGQF